MNFKKFADAVTERFNALYKENYGKIFAVAVDKDEMWQHYLNSFPDGSNPLYRVRTEHDCATCRHFIRNVGNAVFITEDLKVETIWDVRTGYPAYDVVASEMDKYIKSKPIEGIWLSREKRFGGSNVEYDEELGETVTYDHFYVKVPEDLVCRPDRIPENKENYRAIVQVFKRSLTEITDEAVDIVDELIKSNTLYKGSEWESSIRQLKEQKDKIKGMSDEQVNLYAWRKAKGLPVTVSKIRNTSLGTLLIDLSEGMDVDRAVSRYEKVVAPANYKRPKAIYTKKMLEDAKKKIEELGYMDSLQRRFATLDDITVNNILFSNRDAKRRIGGSVFDDMLADVKQSPKKFDRLEEIPVDKFVSDVLPGSTDLEVYLENRHAANMCSVIAPVNKDAPSMFKWNNAFSWAYAGNITDSDVKQNVKNAGGNVDGVLRFSIQWNDTDEYSRNDLDAHCIEPFGNEIFFGDRLSLSGGFLDVDIINPQEGTPAVENIAWPRLYSMRDGVYQFFVHQYSNRGGRDGFRAEIEFDGKVYKFDYRKELRQGEKVRVADVTLKNGAFSIKTYLNEESSSIDLWGLKTNTFVPVSVMMYSPNYWDEQNGIGHKHYMFMLKDCVNPEEPNGFYNEFLKQELVEHKRVFEALGAKMKVETVPDQLSGLGFSSTKRNSVIVKVKGATERMMKIVF